MNACLKLWCEFHLRNSKMKIASNIQYWKEPKGKRKLQTFLMEIKKKDKGSQGRILGSFYKIQHALTQGTGSSLLFTLTLKKSWRNQILYSHKNIVKLFVATLWLFSTEITQISFKKLMNKYGILYNEVFLIHKNERTIDPHDLNKSGRLYNVRRQCQNIIVPSI